MSVTLLILTSCKSNDDARTNEVEVNSTEIVTTETSEKTLAKDNFYTDDSVVYEIKSAYYDESGALIVDGYIVNVTDHVASTMRLKKLEIFNENNELIASNAFGYLQDNFGYVDAGEQIEVSFTFPAVNVYIKDDNLDSVSSVSRFTSVH